MGKVNLLTREGEVEIAKRIESGELLAREEALSTPSAVKESIVLAGLVRSGKISVRDFLRGFHEPHGTPRRGPVLLIPLWFGPLVIR